MSKPALQIENVSKSFGTFHAVRDISLSVPRGSIYGFLGPNGAGKTTVIRMILEIIRPTSGTIAVLGSDSALKVRNRIGYLPEEKGLYKKMKAWGIIAYFATLKGMSRKAARTRAHELLERYGLKDFAETRTDALSKGMGQKVQMLASIAHDPELVILDEPFSGLDPVNQQVMEEMIQDLADRDRTIIFSTHVMQHAERVCNRILLISEGRELFHGSVAEARHTLPRGVWIETDGSPEPLRDLPDILAMEKLETATTLASDSGPTVNRWELRIRENTDPQTILEACFRQGIKLRRFELKDPSLHDVFVHLVGPKAREATFR